MKVGLIDVDGHNFPNLPLMKISAYHKSLGDDVDFINYWDTYDLVYKSKVFTFSYEDRTVIQADKVISGGTGYGLDNNLPHSIEFMYPDYSLYRLKEKAIGFLTRGCHRSCGFCIVNEKEGNSHHVADIDSFWRGQKEIVLLDPNILASKERVRLMNQLLSTKAKVDFTQGLDVRMIDDEILQIITKMRIKHIHFAYDQMKNQSDIERSLLSFKEKTSYNRDKVSVYILINYDTTIEEDLHRVRFVKDLGFSPYVMIYEKELLPKGDIRKKIGRWCNNRRIFWKCDFEDYKG